MSLDLLAPSKLTRDAQFAVNWRKAKILEAKIRVDFTGLDGDQRDLDRHLRELKVEENYLQVLLDKFGITADETPEAIKKILGG